MFALGPVGRRLSMLLVFSAVSASASAQDRCGAILQDGVWEFRQTSNYDRQTSSFLNWFCSQEFESYQAAQDSGGKIGIPVEGIPVEIGGHHRESEWKEYSKAACSLQAGDYEHISEFSHAARKASSVLADAWAKCVAAPGFYATLTYADDPTIFTLQLNYTGMHPSDQAKLRDFLTSPDDVKCRPEVTSESPAIVPNGQQITFLCRRPKEEPVTIVLNADRNITPGNTINVRVVKSSDLAKYREVTAARVDGRDSWISETIVIRAGANIEIAPTDNNPSLTIAAKRLVIEGPFTINGKGMTGTTGAAQTECAVGGCQWTSGPAEDKSRCHDAWINAGGSADDKGRPGHPGSKGGTGAIVTFRYHTLEGNSADAQCNVAGGDGGPGGAGGPGRTLINCSNPANLRRSGPQGDKGPQGAPGDPGQCIWQQVE